MLGVGMICSTGTPHQVSHKGVQICLDTQVFIEHEAQRWCHPEETKATSQTVHASNHAIE
jgi:hypothetical protein